MINIMTLEDNIKHYIDTQIDILSQDNPIIAFIKPLITRAVNKNTKKMSGFLNMISDDEGNIDIETIITEMIENLINTKSFVIKTDFMGDISIGEGKLTLEIPFTGKRLVLGQEDLNIFKNMITTQ